MPKKKPAKIPEKLKEWVVARKKHNLTHTQVQMARELGLNPAKLGKIDNHKQEPWKTPLPEYIENLYQKRFGKSKPEEVRSIEQMALHLEQKKKEKKERKLARQANELSTETEQTVSDSIASNKKQILFLCTWNYYRSRFAEIFFNWQAANLNLDWVADSRGLALPESTPKAISGYTSNYLDQLQIPFDPERRPLDATDLDFEASHRIIAIKRDEHLPIIQKRFEHHAPRVEYWDIHDIDTSTPEEQLPLLHAKVGALISELTGF